MALSSNAAKALKQVEMGLSMLYGASYFTEDEWIRIDGLIHKGQYVFTDGPVKQSLLDGELMSFDDFNTTSFAEPRKEENNEPQIYSAPANSSGNFGTSAETSTEPSDDGSSKKYELFDFSETTTPSVAGLPSLGNQQYSKDIFDFTERKTPSPLGASDFSGFGNTIDLSKKSREPSPVSLVEHIKPAAESAAASTSKNTLHPSATSFQPAPQCATPPSVTPKLQPSAPTFQPSTAPFQPVAQQTLTQIITHEFQPAVASFQPTSQHGTVPVTPKLQPFTPSVETVVPSNPASNEIMVSSVSAPGPACKPEELASEAAMTSFEPPTREIKPIPKEGGLAYYSKDALEELKAFNATLTKAGDKSRPSKAKSKREERQIEFSGGEYQYDDMYDAAPLAQVSHEQDWAMAASPTATENDTRIQSWASEVEDNSIESPAPRTLPTGHHLQNASLIETFIETHGRIPKSLNDIVQPNNPEFRDCISRASNTTTSRSKAKSKAASPAPTHNHGPGKSLLNVQSGTVLIAQSSFNAQSKIQMDVRPGDTIRIVKHVSGIMHVGENQRTGMRGQFPESILKPAPNQDAFRLLEQQRMIAARRDQRAPSVASMAPEVLNARAWEAESVTSKPRATPAKPNPTAGMGLSGSRYALLDDSAAVQQSQVEQLAKQKMDQLVNERLSEMLAAQSLTGVKAPIKEPLNTVVPKTEECYYWRTPGKECRFQAHECRDAHYHIPPHLTRQANLRMGKPTWGALADHVPAASSGHSYSPSGPSRAGQKTKTCWYWKNGTCENTPEECKYVHEDSILGVADKPNGGGWKRRPTYKNWRSNDDAGEESVWGGNKDGEDQGEETKGEDWATNDGTAESVSVSDSWNISSETYRAPHLRALEQRAAIATNGW